MTGLDRRLWDRIVGALRLQPMSALEVARCLNQRPNDVQDALSIMQARGMVARLSTGDGWINASRRLPRRAPVRAVAA